MSTRRNFLRVTGAAALVGAGALSISNLRSDKPEDSDLYSDIEKALAEENPDIPVETIKAIAADYGHISTKIKAGTAGLSGLTGAFYDNMTVSENKDFFSGYNFLAAFFSHLAVANSAIDNHQIEASREDMQMTLQKQYGLSPVQSIHVEKTLREQIKGDFRFEYGAFASIAGSAAHRVAHFIESKRKPSDGSEPGLD
jgi:hypothetical protein